MSSPGLLEAATRIIAIGMAVLGLFTDSAVRILFAVFMWMTIDSRRNL